MLASWLSSTVDFLNYYVWSFPEVLPWLVVVLLGTGLFITVRLHFIQFRKVGHALAIVAGRYDDDDDEGDITHFQALSTALSATVGIGNIAGVATAIHYGGPGAILWMWVTAVFGMAVKYAECTLAVKYRRFDEHGNVAGGPMYYIEYGLGEKFKPLAMLFAACGAFASFGTGNMNQANTVAVSARADFGTPSVVVGILCAAVVGSVILGGIKRIARVSSRLAPAMASLYVAGALLILLFHLPEVPGAFATIISHAFNPQASLGGSVAGLFSVTMLWGVKRGLFSNEAGQGSAPIAHAAARTDEPVREGAVALLEPMIDTLIICTMTALCIISTGVWDEKHPSSLPITHTTVLRANALPPAEPGVSEASRLQAALDAPSALVRAEVVDGRQSHLAFIGRDSLVEDAVLLQNGSPYTGPLVFTPQDGSLVPDDLMVEGRMLLNSSALTARAFERGLSPLTGGGNYLVALCVFMFAISTMISWSYYGDRCVTYLVGDAYVLPYRILFTGFVFLGSVLALETVWAYGDLVLGIMILPNLTAIILLSGTVVRLTKEYFSRMREQHGE